MTGRLPLAFILITVMIDSMGIGLILPVMPELIAEVGASTAELVEGLGLVPRVALLSFSNFGSARHPCRGCGTS